MNSGIEAGIKLLQPGVYLLSGEMIIEFQTGEAEVIGKILGKNEKLTLPRGKRIPIHILKSSQLKFYPSVGASIEKVDTITIPDSWNELVSLLYNKTAKSVLILGEVDTGKTFLTLYLTNKLINLKKTVAVLDMDIGQSDIGPPGTIGLLILNKQVTSFSEHKPTALYYVGSHSPSLHFMPYIVGYVKLTTMALNQADILFIDTPGWVHGDGARVLRKSEIELLMPDFIILLQRKNELEHLVHNYPQEKIFRLTVSKNIRPRNADERKSLREKISKEYFKNICEVEFDFSKILTDRVYLLTGQEITNDLRTKLPSLREKILWAEILPSYEGMLVVSKSELLKEEESLIMKTYEISKLKTIVDGEEVGIEVALCDENYNVLGLGIIKKIDFINQKMKIFAPVEANEISRTKIIQFGSLKLTSDGSEDGFVAPGKF